MTLTSNAKETRLYLFRKNYFQFFVDYEMFSKTEKHFLLTAWLRELVEINSHAVGMAVAQPLDFEIDFARNPISGSAAWFFVIILKFIFTISQKMI